MRIRKFRTKDAESVCNLIRRNDLEVSSKFYSPEVIDYWGKGLTPEKILDKSRGQVCFVAEENKRIIGYIYFSGNEIKKLHVSPDFHRKGIGMKLMNKIEMIARKNKIKRLILYSNLYAEPFYKRCGFQKIKDYWQKAGDVKYRSIYMEKELK